MNTQQNSEPTPHRRQRDYCLGTADEYLHGEIGAFEAAARVRDCGLIGKLFAGEVLLDAAAHHAVDDIESAIRESHHILKPLGKIAYDACHVTDLDSVIGAAYRHAQMPLLDAVILERHPPATKVVEESYHKLVNLGRQVIGPGQHLATENTHAAGELIGRTSEIAVLLLGLRFALRKAGPSDWLPLQSFFSEDHGGSSLEFTGKDAWDLNVYVPQDGVPEPEYRLQVKSSRSIWSKARQIFGLPTVHVSDDLSLPERGRVISANIIEECAQELVYPYETPEITRRLDRRTERLLDILEAYKKPESHVVTA